MLVELVAQPHCLYLLCTEAIKYVYTILTGFLYKAKTKTQISLAVTVKLISAFVFASRIMQFLYLLNPKF